MPSNRSFWSWLNRIFWFILGGGLLFGGVGGILYSEVASTAYYPMDYVPITLGMLAGGCVCIFFFGLGWLWFKDSRLL